MHRQDSTNFEIIEKMLDNIFGPDSKISIKNTLEDFEIILYWGICTN